MAPMSSRVPAVTPMKSGLARYWKDRALPHWLQNPRFMASDDCRHVGAPRVKANPPLGNTAQLENAPPVKRRHIPQWQCTTRRGAMVLR